MVAFHPRRNCRTRNLIFVGDVCLSVLVIVYGVNDVALLDRINMHIMSTLRWQRVLQLSQNNNGFQLSVELSEPCNRNKYIQGSKGCCLFALLGVFGCI